MVSTAGVGFSERIDSDEAGFEAAARALASAGLDGCDFALLFNTDRHDPERVQAGARRALGPAAALIGGGAAGVITGDQLGYEGTQVGVAVFRSDSIRAQRFLARGLRDDEQRCGRELGRQLAPLVGEPGASLVLMYESVADSTPEGPRLNLGAPLLAGVRSALPAWPPVVGLALTGDPRWKPGRQYFDDRLEVQSAMALLLTGDVRMHTVTITNLRPMSTYRRVTAADGPLLLELDGRPAVEAIGELFAGSLAAQDFPLQVTLGVNRGDKFGEYREDDYSLHLCVAVDQARGALIVDNPIEPGVELQLMRRHVDCAEVRRRADELVAATAGRRRILAFYIDCIGRAAKYAGSEREEASEVQAALAGLVPLLGVYSGGEVARVGGQVQRLTNAGVLSIFSEA